MKASKWEAVVVIMMLMTTLAGCIGASNTAQTGNLVAQSEVRPVNPEVKPIAYPLISGTVPAIPNRDPFVPLIATNAPAANQTGGQTQASPGNGGSQQQLQTPSVSPPSQQPSSIDTLQLLNVYQENGVPHATFSNNGNYVDAKVGDEVSGYIIAGIDVPGAKVTLSIFGQTVTLFVPKPVK